MDNQQLLECLQEIMRITRSFREAIQQITELKVEVAALYQIIEANGIATAEQLAEVREESRGTLHNIECSAAVHSLSIEPDGEWKM